MQPVPFTNKVLISNPAHGEVCSIQHCMIQFVSDLRQVGGFLWFPPPIKLTATINIVENGITHHNTNPILMIAAFRKILSYRDIEFTDYY
jgi:hypothetical protein